ncbi:hypothetical protein [uncultured Ruegeria sp.]|uniref:hypothetical protein n=1 Tax=uncultured Ruegeria sp. TaxID=259304 RepID=UPI002607B362|nr:hypothetical protein [uncultured Ruegeria sp.]
MRASPLHPLFELIVHDIDLREVAGDTLYPDIRQAFETHSALLFPKQSIPDTYHVRIAELFGRWRIEELWRRHTTLNFRFPN